MNRFLNVLIPILGLAVFVQVSYFTATAPAVSPHDRKVIEELAELVDTMDGVCYGSLSLAQDGMWENDCGNYANGGDEYVNDPGFLANVGKCNAKYARYEANPYWDLEDLLCKRDALRAELQMSADDQAKIDYRWWDGDAKLINGKWFCANLFDREPLELTCADRDATN